MTISEYDVYKFLNQSTSLTDFMNDVRGKRLSNNPIFVGTPVNSFVQNKNAPWIRITSIPGDLADYADDERIIEYPRFQIDFWIVKTKAQESVDMERLIYKLMRSFGFERYYKYRATDPDMTDLLMVQSNYEFQGLA
ncbi:hypothetical protein [Companilactobacillus ginsenosidimutans]|uniref:hypothetical protein n=2 Tax=Companilactobacillus TaxID=2767879 RepID=UPI00069DE6F6|nr:hypothetical protein [Companilactobacillus ginsenosidimutans]